MSLARRVLPESRRRGWCPSLARPMPTGDGLLARVHPPLGRLSPEQIRVVAEGARRFGNGHVDVTARANLQIRGVTEATTAPLATLLAAAGLGDRRSDGGPQRLTLTSPLAGIDPEEPVDVLALAGAIEAAALGIPGLPPKTLVAIQGPGVSGEGADIVLKPEAGGGVGIALAGTDDPCGPVSPSSPDPHPEGAERSGGLEGRFQDPLGRREGSFAAAVAAPQGEEMGGIGACGDAPNQTPPGHGAAGQDDSVIAAVTAVLRAFAATRQRRMRDLTSDQRAAVLHANDRDAHAPSLHRREGRDRSLAADDALHPGRIPLVGLAILSLEAPFGRCTAEGLEALAEIAESIGCRDIRVSPSRGFVLPCPHDVNAPAALERFAVAGFVTTRDDPRRAVAACPGAPACASGSTPVQADAERLARAFAPFAGRGLSAHVSGCAKGCAHPAPAALTLVGEGGRYRIVHDGAPSAASGPLEAFESVLERVSTADPTQPLDQAFRP